MKILFKEDENKDLIIRGNMNEIIDKLRLVKERMSLDCWCGWTRNLEWLFSCTILLFRLGWCNSLDFIYFYF